MSSGAAHLIVLRKRLCTDHFHLLYVHLYKLGLLKDQDNEEVQSTMDLSSVSISPEAFANLIQKCNALEISMEQSLYCPECDTKLTLMQSLKDPDGYPKNNLYHMIYLFFDLK